MLPNCLSRVPLSQPLRGCVANVAQAGYLVCVVYLYANPHVALPPMLPKLRILCTFKPTLTWLCRQCCLTCLSRVPLNQPLRGFVAVQAPLNRPFRRIDV